MTFNTSVSHLRDTNDNMSEAGHNSLDVGAICGFGDETFSPERESNILDSEKQTSFHNSYAASEKGESFDSKQLNVQSRELTDGLVRVLSRGRELDILGDEETDYSDRDKKDGSRQKEVPDGKDRLTEREAPRHYQSNVESRKDLEQDGKVSEGGDGEADKVDEAKAKEDDKLDIFRCKRELGMLVLSE